MPELVAITPTAYCMFVICGLAPSSWQMPKHNFCAVTAEAPTTVPFPPNLVNIRTFRSFGNTINSAKPKKRNIRIV